MFIVKRPWIVFTSALLAGISIGFSEYPENLFWLIGAILTALLIKFCFFRFEYSSSEIFYGSMIFFFFMFGIFTAQFTPFYNTSQLQYFYDKQVTVGGEVKDVSTSGNITYLTLKLYKISNGSKTEDADTKLRITLFENNAEYIPGDVITVRGTLKKFNRADFYASLDTFEYFAAKGIYGKISVSARDIQLYKKSSRLLDLNRIGYKARRYISNSLGKHFTGEKKALIENILTGRTEEHDDTLSDKLRLSGISHITCVSVQHVGYFLIFAGLMLSFSGIRKKRYVISTISALFIYSVIIGFSPSLVRAVIMASYSVIVSFAGLRRDSLTSLFLSTAVLCIINPYIMLGIGFQLSFTAVLAIIMSYSVYKRSKGKITRPVYAGLIMPVTVLIFIAPLTAKSFNSVVLASLITNLLVSPFVILTMLLGYLVCALPFLSFVTVPLLSCASKVILIVSDIFSGISVLSVNVPSPSTTFIIGYVLLIALIFALIYKKNITAFILFFLLATTVSSSFTVQLIEAERSGIAVMPSTDTEALHISAYDGNDILVNLYTNTDKYLLSKGIKHIDAIVFTQTNAAFSDYLSEILKASDVKAVFLPEKQDNYRSENTLNLLEIVKKHDIELFFYEENDIINIGKTKLTAIYNNTEQNHATALGISCDGASILCAGSLSDEAQLALADYREYKCDVLIIPNGYRDAFTEQVKADYITVIDKSGKPHLENENSLNPKKDVFDTYRSRTVYFSFDDGEIYTISRRTEDEFWH